MIIWTVEEVADTSTIYPKAIPTKTKTNRWMVVYTSFWEVTVPYVPCPCRRN
jgi:hypothetical protein